MSAAARQHEIYLVINIQEQMDCTKPQAEDEYCPEAKNYLFNTNVVFNRAGVVIDRWALTLSYYFYRVVLSYE